MSPLRTHRLLLIDDDPVFCRAMASLGKANAISVVHGTAPEDANVARYLPFDAVVIDYDLGNVTGERVAQAIASLGRRLPVLLVSAHESTGLRHWPSCVKGFVSKSRGPQAVLDTAIALAAPARAVKDPGP